MMEQGGNVDSHHNEQYQIKQGKQKQQEDAVQFYRVQRDMPVYQVARGKQIAACRHRGKCKKDAQQFSENKRRPLHGFGKYHPQHSVFFFLGKRIIGE